MTLCAAALLGLAQSTPAAMVFTSGHGDFSVGFNEVEGEFEFGYHLGEGDDTAIVGGAIIDDVEFEPADLRVRVSESITVAAGTSQALLDGTGTSVGSTIYLISQDSDGISSVILGLGTEELEQPPGVTWSDVTYTLDGSRGPGLFSLYFNDGNSFDFGISEAEGINSFTFPAGGHEERNWTFTAPGVYELDFTASATRTVAGEGSTPFSASGTFTFVVPEPSSTLLLGSAALGFLLRRRRR